MPGPVEKLLRDFGKNSNSFLGLYPGYNYFYLDDPSLGCIAYLRTRTAWMGVAEPLASPEHQVALLHAFAKEAKAAGKSAVLLPSSGSFREWRSRTGFVPSKSAPSPI